ncbi:hypothetical protein [Burkholderia cenocepacia]|uniref:hypothetical protein n=1 Tax=Burkholderia cenocepacia TaxID=95486 RepID=UPI001BA6B887|nr:hypothetical protein [Burkholderia cenocepacia]
MRSRSDSPRKMRTPLFLRRMWHALRKPTPIFTENPDFAIDDEAYDAGFRSVELDANPYQPGTRKYKSWEAGRKMWKDLDDRAW